MARISTSHRFKGCILFLAAEFTAGNVHGAAGHKETILVGQEHVGRRQLFGLAGTLEGNFVAELSDSLGGVEWRGMLGVQIGPVPGVCEGCPKLYQVPGYPLPYSRCNTTRRLRGRWVGSALSATGLVPP